MLNVNASYRVLMLINMLYPECHMKNCQYIMCSCHIGSYEWKGSLSNFNCVARLPGFFIFAFLVFSRCACCGCLKERKNLPFTCCFPV